ncbi:hypothetical protein RU07_23020 [Agrobacterium tumefaciens]|uniref:Uncharacterized protein n=1 Tax=Agrobacterium tumefaciens TaxID=358 RepID=A0A0D0KMA8_AGRTU|nr:hypothetical protein RU07_23020 [Agrobacterium tumefaciens]
MNERDYSLRSLYEQESLQVSDSASLQEVPGTLKFFGVIAAILVAAWAVDQALITIPDWYSAIFG